MKLFLFIAAILTLAFTPTATASRGGGGTRTRLEVRMESPTSQASGTAKFEQRGSRMKFSVEVEDVNGTDVVITAGGQSFDLHLDGSGFGDLNRDTRNGQSVPSLKEGDEVVVWLGGQVLMRGNLERD